MTRIATPDLVFLDTVKAESVRWLWPGRIPIGAITLLIGDPGLGKSTVSLAAAALVSKGSEIGRASCRERVLQVV